MVGLGRIGREAALRCRAFGMEVQAFDPFVAPAVAEQAHVKLRSLDELLQSSDYLTLHTTLTPETRHLIGQQARARVKPGVRIVNAARGELIDDAALLAALESGRVAGAGLDVHAQEPPKDWRLAKHPKVLALPHLGPSTREAQERVRTDIAQQVRDYLKGGVIQSAVNQQALQGRAPSERAKKRRCAHAQRRTCALYEGVQRWHVHPEEEGDPEHAFVAHQPPPPGGHRRCSAWSGR